MTGTIEYRFGVCTANEGGHGDGTAPEPNPEYCHDSYADSVASAWDEIADTLAQNCPSYDDFDGGGTVTTELLRLKVWCISTGEEYAATACLPAHEPGCGAGRECLFDGTEGGERYVDCSKCGTRRYTWTERDDYGESHFMSEYQHADHVAEMQSLDREAGPAAAVEVDLAKCKSLHATTTVVWLGPVRQSWLTLGRSVAGEWSCSISYGTATSGLGNVGWIHGGDVPGAMKALEACGLWAHGPSGRLPRSLVNGGSVQFITTEGR